MNFNGLGAIAYALLALAPITVQLAIAAGAPLGYLTLGGRWPGKLPLFMRPVCILQAALLAGMAATVLTAGGVLDLSWTRSLFWPVMGLTGLTLVSNAASPSRPERRLWVPIILLMLVSAAIVAADGQIWARLAAGGGVVILLLALIGWIRAEADSVPKVRAGMGIGLLTVDKLRYEQEPQIERVLPNWHRQIGKLSLLWPKARVPSPSVRAFVDFVSERFTTHMARPPAAVATR